MKGIILAAGRGSRMAKLTFDRPKCLVNLRGKTLLEWQLDAFRKSGISEIGIVTGYRHEMLSAYGSATFHNPRWSETQMVTSLSCATTWLEADVCIISYSDIFYEASAIASLTECNSDIAVTYDPSWQRLWKARFEEPLTDAETFRLNADGTLAEIGNKPISLSDVQGQYMGLIRTTPRGWTALQYEQNNLPPGGADKMQMTQAINAVISNQKFPVEAVAYNSIWGEVDSEDDLMLYEQNTI